METKRNKKTHSSNGLLPRTVDIMQGIAFHGYKQSHKSTSRIAMYPKGNQMKRLAKGNMIVTNMKSNNTNGPSPPSHFSYLSLPIFMILLNNWNGSSVVGC